MNFFRCLSIDSTAFARAREWGACARWQETHFVFASDSMWALDSAVAGRACADPQPPASAPKSDSANAATATEGVTVILTMA